MELQLQELLEFPEVTSDQITTSHTDNPGGEVVPSTEKRSLQNSCRSRGRCIYTTSKIKVEKPYYRQPVAHRRQLVGWQTFDRRKQKDR